MKKFRHILSWQGAGGEGLAELQIVQDVQNEVQQWTENEEHLEEQEGIQRSWFHRSSLF